MCVQASNIISSNVSSLYFFSHSIFYPFPSFPFPFFPFPSLPKAHPLTPRPPQIYQDDDKPIYKRGNKILLGILAWNVVLIIGIKAYYMWRNSSREKKWAAMTQAEKDTYLATTTDRGNKRYVIF